MEGEVQNDWNYSVSESEKSKDPLPSVIRIFLTSWQFFFIAVYCSSIFIMLTLTKQNIQTMPLLSLSSVIINLHETHQDIKFITT